MRILSVELFRCELRTRLPFRYGIVTMTELPHVFLRLRVEHDGQTGEGVSADNLPPKWFTKQPDVAISREIGDMLANITQAARASLAIEGDTLFDWWEKLFSTQQVWAQQQHIPELLAHFGTSLVERAAHDACCRLLRQPWHLLIRSNAFGIDWRKWEPSLADEAWQDLLPLTPLHTATLRHTVGMADALREAEVQQPRHDGLPESLEASISRYGLREFKLKLSGQLTADMQRLRATAQVINEGAPPDFRFSLDANEQFTSPAELRTFGEAMLEDPILSPFFEHLAFIEQPLARRIALAPDQSDIRAAWPSRVPIIIDESDGGQTDFPRALSLGYSGVSHKNCKGLFKSLRNALLVARHRQTNPSDRFWMTSGEDLANIGPIGLLQDLAVQAALGNASIERNGHQYFAGLSSFPANLVQAAQALHPDLYQIDSRHKAILRINNGLIDLASVNAAPLGCALPATTKLPGQCLLAIEAKSQPE